MFHKPMIWDFWKRDYLVKFDTSSNFLFNKIYLFIYTLKILLMDTIIHKWNQRKNLINLIIIKKKNAVKMLENIKLEFI